jgi:C4-dicarboxylate-specific signal transduction histidine kinase
MRRRTADEERSRQQRGSTYRSDPGGLAPVLAPERLEQINRMMTVGRLMSNLTHELNNSFQVIGASVEMLARTDLSPDAAVRVSKIGAQTARAAHVIRDFLLFARPEGGGQTRLDVGELVERTLLLRRYQISRSGIGLTTTGTERGPSHVRGNAQELQQALLNLIINAEQAVVGRERPHIRAAVVHARGQVTTAISDNGSGVPPDLRERIFEPFFTTRPPNQAAGLGLTVANFIARRHGGSITLADAPEGATFVLALPSIE